MRQKLRTLISISSLCITALLLVVVIFGWYATNKVAVANGGTGATGEGPTPEYYLGTEGTGESSVTTTKNFIDYLFPTKTTKEEYVTSDGTTVSLATTKTNSSIEWNLSETSNMNNHGDAEGIQPSSDGKLEFYVIPTEDMDELSFKLNTDILGFEYNRTHKSYQRVEEVYESYARSHILFFASYSDNTYSDWLYDNHTITLSNVSKNVAYKLTIYWVWPSVLSQILLKTGNYYLYGRHCILSEDTQTSLITKMKTLSNLWYKNGSTTYTDVDVNNAVADIDNLSVSQVTQSFSVENYKVLNSSYNNVDQLIGMNIDYLKVNLKTVV